ncbi:MAG: hypothetical protein WB611_31395 [Stellaceae bacterium]
MLGKFVAEKGHVGPGASRADIRAWWGDLLQEPRCHDGAVAADLGTIPVREPSAKRLQRGPTLAAEFRRCAPVQVGLGVGDQRFEHGRQSIGGKADAIAASEEVSEARLV